MYFINIITRYTTLVVMAVNPVVGILEIFEKLVFGGGALYAVMGLVNLGQGIKERNGNEIQSAIWSILGGGAIIAASLLIGQIDIAF